MVCLLLTLGMPGIALADKECKLGFARTARAETFPWRPRLENPDLSRWLDPYAGKPLDADGLAEVVAWMRWHRASFDACAAELSRRGIGFHTPEQLEQLFHEHQKKRIDEIMGRPLVGDDAQLRTIRELDSLTLEPKEISRLLSNRLSGDWGPERVTEILSGKDNHIYVYHPMFENRRLMAEVVARAREAVTHLRQFQREEIRQGGNLLYATRKLTADEERNLVLAMNYLKYRASKLSTRFGPLVAKDPSHDDSKLVRQWVEESQGFRNILLEAHVRVARRLALRLSSRTAPTAELMDSAVDALWEAIEHFDVTRDNRLVTYAHVAMSRAVRATRRRIIAERRTESAGTDFADTEGGPSYRLFDSPERTSSPEAPLLTGLAKEQVTAALGALTRNQREVIGYLFGIDGKPVLNLADTARKLGKDRQAIHQTRDRALERLRQYFMRQGRPRG